MSGRFKSNIVGPLRVTKRLHILSAFVGAVLVACSASVPQPTATDIARAERQWPDLQPGDLETGRTLYVGRCGSCHRLERPSSRAPDVWPRKIDAMSRRAGLSRADQELITRYVVTIAERAELKRHEPPP